jgi:hypothetical protein
MSDFEVKFLRLYVFFIAACCITFFSFCSSLFLVKLLGVVDLNLYVGSLGGFMGFLISWKYKGKIVRNLMYMG